MGLGLSGVNAALPILKQLLAAAAANQRSAASQGGAPQQQPTGPVWSEKPPVPIDGTPQLIRRDGTPVPLASDPNRNPQQPTGQQATPQLNAAGQPNFHQRMQDTMDLYHSVQSMLPQTPGPAVSLHPSTSRIGRMLGLGVDDVLRDPQGYPIDRQGNRIDPQTGGHPVPVGYRTKGDLIAAFLDPLAQSMSAALLGTRDRSNRNFWGNLLARGVPSAERYVELPQIKRAAVAQQQMDQMKAAGDILGKMAPYARGGAQSTIWAAESGPGADPNKQLAWGKDAFGNVWPIMGPNNQQLSRTLRDGAWTNDAFDANGVATHSTNQTTREERSRWLQPDGSYGPWQTTVPRGAQTQGGQPASAPTTTATPGPDQAPAGDAAAGPGVPTAAATTGTEDNPWQPVNVGDYITGAFNRNTREFRKLGQGVDLLWDPQGNPVVMAGDSAAGQASPAATPAPSTMPTSTVTAGGATAAAPSTPPTRLPFLGGQVYGRGGAGKVTDQWVSLNDKRPELQTYVRISRDGTFLGAVTDQNGNPVTRIKEGASDTTKMDPLIEAEIGPRPDPSDYEQGKKDPDYLSAMQQWGEAGEVIKARRAGAAAGAGAAARLPFQEALADYRQTLHQTAADKKDAKAAQVFHDSNTVWEGLKNRGIRPEDDPVVFYRAAVNVLVNASDTPEKMAAIDPILKRIHMELSRQYPQHAKELNAALLAATAMLAGSK